MPLDPDVEREFRRFARDLEQAEKRLWEEFAETKIYVADIRNEIKAELREVEQRQLADIRRRLEIHIEETRKQFDDRAKERTREQAIAAKERAQEQAVALKDRKTDLKWRITTAIGIMVLIISAVAVLLNAIGGATP